MEKHEQIVCTGLLLVILSVSISIRGYTDMALRPSESVSPIPECITCQIQSDIGELSHRLSYLKYMNGELSLTDYLSHANSPAVINFTEKMYVDYSEVSTVRCGESSGEIMTMDCSNREIGLNALTPKLQVKHDVSVLSQNISSTAFNYDVDTLLSEEVPVPIRFSLSDFQQRFVHNYLSWDIVSQKIYVPKGHKYKVEWVVDDKIVKAKYNISTRICSQIKYNNEPNLTSSGSLPIGRALEEEFQIRNRLFGEKTNSKKDDVWVKIDDNYAKRVWTEGTLSIRYGSDLKIRVTDITNNLKSKVVSLRLLDSQ
ncbi:hypothetical protein [Lactococcus garvieae]|uniref:hypothetical protein n=1 Tax=Lactococcus garvieae TaxID=1363 RepID=UPI003851A0B8